MKCSQLLRGVLHALRVRSFHFHLKLSTLGPWEKGPQYIRSKLGSYPVIFSGWWKRVRYHCIFSSKSVYLTWCLFFLPVPESSSQVWNLSPKKIYQKHIFWELFFTQTLHQTVFYSVRVQKPPQWCFFLGGLDPIPRLVWKAPKLHFR